MNMEKINEAAEKYAKQYAHETAAIETYIHAATSDAAKQYWFEQFKAEQVSGKYSWFDNHEEELPYTVAHSENDVETVIAVTDTAEKAHFLATAANQYKDSNVKELAEVMELDGKINTCVRLYGLDYLKEIQRLFWRAIDAINEANPTAEQKQSANLVGLVKFLREEYEPEFVNSKYWIDVLDENIHLSDAQIVEKWLEKQTV